MDKPTVASQIHERRARLRRLSRAVAAVIVLCCASFLLAITAATARPARQGQPPGTPPPGSQHPPPAPSQGSPATNAGGAGSEAATSTPQGSRPAPSRATGSGAPASGPHEGRGGQTQQGPRHDRQDQTSPSGGGSPQGPAGPAGTETQPRGQAQPSTVTDQQPSAQQDSAGSQARGRHKETGGETGRHKETERTHERSKRSKGGSSQPTPVSSGSSGEASSTAPAPAPAPPAPAVAVGASAASVSPAAALAQQTPPSVSATHLQAAHEVSPGALHRPSRGRTVGKPAAASGARALGPAGRLGGSREVADDRPTARVRRRSPRAAHGPRTMPLTSTITRIVDVVPTPVRMLIAGLLGLAIALAARSRLAARDARSLERQRVQLLADVGLLQAALLPTPPARLGPVGASVAYKPAAGPGAGGDFYDVFALEDGQVAVIVGDVSGHGRQALPHTALLRFTLRAYLEAGLSPRDAVQTAGAVLEHQLGGQFATVVLATYNPRDRVLLYACAGHPAPVVLGPHADGDSIAHVTAGSSPPIGVGLRTGTRQTTVSLRGSSQICFFTDGVTEARVGSELFGSKRLLDTLAGLGGTATAADVLDGVVEQADARPDDMAACLLRLEGGEEAPAVLVEELELDREAAVSERTERFLLECGLERGEVAEVTDAAAAAAGSDGTVVLECRRTGGPPRVTLRRDELSYLHVRRAGLEMAR